MVGLLKGKIDLVLLVAVSVIDRIEGVIYLNENGIKIIPPLAVA